MANSRNRSGRALTGRPWRTAAARIRAMRLPCWLCYQPIDYQAEPRTPWSFSVDHVIPRSRGGSVLDPENLRPSHFSCNSARGAGPAPEYVTPASRDW